MNVLLDYGAEDVRAAEAIVLLAYIDLPVSEWWAVAV